MRPSPPSCFSPERGSIDLARTRRPAGLFGPKAVAVGIAAVSVGTGVWVSHDLGRLARCGSPRSFDALEPRCSGRRRPHLGSSGRSSTECRRVDLPRDSTVRQAVTAPVRRQTVPRRATRCPPSATQRPLLHPKQARRRTARPRLRPDTEAAAAPGDRGTDVRDNRPPTPRRRPHRPTPTFHPSSPGNPGRHPASRTTLRVTEERLRVRAGHRQASRATRPASREVHPAATRTHPATLGSVGCLARPVWTAPGPRQEGLPGTATLRGNGGETPVTRRRATAATPWAHGPDGRFRERVRRTLIGHTS